MSTRLPSDEASRLSALYRYQILDTPPEDAFERIVRLTEKVFQVPIVLITFVDADRQWFKACEGLGVTETSRDVSFCAHAILQPEVMVVEDACADARFEHNPLVTGEPNIRFYAGAPLETSDGHRLGTLCIIDRESRSLPASQRAMLADLAALVMDELHLRLEVAERRRVERALQASERRYRGLVEHATDWIWEIDADNRLTYVSPSVTKLLGYAPADLIGTALCQVVAPSHTGQLADLLASCRQEQRAFSLELVRLRHRDGGDLYVELSGTPVDDASAVGSIQGLAHDVSIHQEAEASLQLALDRAHALNDLKSRFVSIVSHEFRGPLTAIQVAAEVLQQLTREASTPRLGAQVERIQRSILRLTDLIDDVLDLGTLEGVEQRALDDTIDVGESLRQIAADVQVGLDLGHAFEIAGAHLPVRLRTDAGLFQLIFGNLFSNALKYSASGSTVHVSVHEADEEVVISVRDEGIGIPAAELPELFGPFYRASNAPAARGTGLGLSIVKQAVELCGGSVDVASVLGEGTVFTVAFPVLEHQPADAVAE